MKKVARENNYFVSKFGLCQLSFKILFFHVVNRGNSMESREERESEALYRPPKMSAFLQSPFRSPLPSLPRINYYPRCPRSLANEQRAPVCYRTARQRFYRVLRSSRALVSARKRRGHARYRLLVPTREKEFREACIPGRATRPPFHF